MLAACPWVTLVATFVPQTLPQPTLPTTVSRVAASSMFMPLTGARQSSSAELSSSQKQLCQQLAQSASGSTLSLNLNGCALHRARTRTNSQTALASTHVAAHAQQLCALCSVLLAVGSPHGALRCRRSARRFPLSARRPLRSALCSLLSLRTPNPLSHPNPNPNLSTSALAMLLALRSVWLSALRPSPSALRSPRAPHAAARRTPPHAARHMLAPAPAGTRSSRCAASTRRAWRRPARRSPASRSPTSRWPRPSVGVATRARRCAPSRSWRATA